MQDYILGDHDEEIKRLKFQHGVWTEEVSLFWKRAGISRGMKGLDAGCGPGFTSIELAELVLEDGSITAFDGSQKYISYLEKQIHVQSLKNITPKKGDLLQTSFPDNHFDFVYIRMVLIFISDLDTVLNEFKRILKPGGMLLINDFYDYEKFIMNTHAPEFEHLLSLITSDFENRDSNLQVGKKLTRLLGKKEYLIENIKADCKTAFPHDNAWSWPQMFFENFIPDLLQRKKISSKQVEDFWQEWNTLSRDKYSCFLSPALLSIIARK